MQLLSAGDGAGVPLLDLLDESLRFARAEAAHELQLVEAVLVVDEVVDVDADGVQLRDVDLLKHVHQAGLVDALLEWVQVQVQGLVQGIR